MIQEERVRVTRARLGVFDRALGTIWPYRPGEPSRVDIALGMPEVREVIDRPPRDTVDEESFSFLHEALPAFRTQWRREAETYLRSLVRTQVGKLSKGVDPMELAVGIAFRCKLCNAVEKYPEVLSHACEEHNYNADEEKGDLYRRVIVEQFTPNSRYHNSGLVHWDPSVHKFSAEADAIRPLAKLLGLDPRRATTADMNASPKRLVCKTCSRKGVFYIMNWASAVSLHFVDISQCQAAHHGVSQYKHYSSPPGELITEKEYRRWKREGSDRWTAKGCYIVALPEHQAEAARLLERTAEKDNVDDGREWWHCGLCPVLERCGDTWSGRYSKPRILEHVQQK